MSTQSNRIAFFQRTICKDVGEDRSARLKIARSFTLLLWEVYIAIFSLLVVYQIKTSADVVGDK